MSAFFVVVVFHWSEAWDLGRRRIIDGELGDLGVQALVLPLELAQDLCVDNFDRLLLQWHSGPAHLAVGLTMTAWPDWSIFGTCADPLL